jgi:hypothetical protein
MPIQRIYAEQKFNEVAKLVEDASAATNEFEGFLREKAQRYGCSYIIGPPKELPSIEAKKRYDIFSEPKKIFDYRRGMLIVPDKAVATITTIAHELHPKNNAHIKGISDRISEPLYTGFRGLYLYPEMSNGHVCEVIVLTESMKAAYEKSAPYYTKLTELLFKSGHKTYEESSDEERELLDLIREINNYYLTEEYARLQLEDPT